MHSISPSIDFFHHQNGLSDNSGQNNTIKIEMTVNFFPLKLL